MAISTREVISFTWLYIIYQSLLIHVYVKKEKKEKKREKNSLYVPLYHSSWGMCMYATSCCTEYI